MIKRIILHNFMAHEETVLELAPGLNVLTGPNNSGKSAVVAALTAASYNESGTSYVIRHGAAQASVEILVEEEQGNERTIIWTRKPKTSKVTVDDQGNSRGGDLVIAGQSGADILRLNPAVIRSDDGDGSGDVVDVHFGSQKSPIFAALDKSKIAAALFASMGDAIYIERMKKRHSDYVNDARRQLRQLDKDITQLCADIALLTPAGELQQPLKALQQEESALAQAVNLSEHLKKTIAELESASKQQDFRREMVGVFGMLEETPAWEPAEALEVEINSLLRAMDHAAYQLDRWKSLQSLGEPISLIGTDALEETITAILHADRLVDEWQARDEAYRGLNKPIPPDSTVAIQDIITRYNVLESRILALEESKSVYRELAPAPEFTPVDTLDRMIAEYSQSLEQYSRAESRVVALAQLEAAPTILDPLQLSVMICEIQKLLNTIIRLSCEAEKAKNAVKEIKQEIEVWISANPTCPVCGGLLHADRLMTGGHKHDAA